MKKRLVAFKELRYFLKQKKSRIIVNQHMSTMCTEIERNKNLKLTKQKTT